MHHSDPHSQERDPQARGARETLGHKAMPESFFAMLKTELVDEQHYHTREQAVASIGDYTSTSVLLQPNPLAPGRPAFLRARALKFLRLGAHPSTSGVPRSGGRSLDSSTSGFPRPWVWGAHPSTSGFPRPWVWGAHPSTSGFPRS